MPSMTALSDKKQSILCTEYLRGQVLIKSSVKKKNITVNKEKHFTNCCKEITQGLMGFCGKTTGCNSSRRICRCLNRLQKGCRKNDSSLKEGCKRPPLLLQTGKSSRAKELQVLVATDWVQGKVARVLLLEIRGHFTYKIAVCCIPQKSNRFCNCWKNQVVGEKSIKWCLTMRHCQIWDVYT